MLADPRGLFASGHVAPIVSDKVLAAHGADCTTAIDAVTPRADDLAMREMNAAVVVRSAPPARSRREFLRARGLL